MESEGVEGVSTILSGTVNRDSGVSVTVVASLTVEDGALREGEQAGGDEHVEDCERGEWPMSKLVEPVDGSWSLLVSRVSLGR